MTYCNKIALVLILFLSFPALAEQHASRIIVYKAERKMVLLDKRDNIIRMYRIALGENPVGPKMQEGDEKTPEGHYIISGRNPHSKFYKSLRISYPNAEDRAQAAKRGVSPGGNIMIHGVYTALGWLGTFHRVYDKWTDGCISVMNREMDEIWEMVPDGTPIEIRP